MARYAVEVTYLQSNGIRVMRVYYPRAEDALDAQFEAAVYAMYDKLTEPEVGRAYPVSQLGEDVICRACHADLSRESHQRDCENAEE